MIPDEAVEAGYAVMGYLAIGRDEIRAILEAAAPHLMAQAWEEGYGAAETDTFVASQGFRGRLPNPYRTAK